MRWRTAAGSASQSVPPQVTCPAATPNYTPRTMASRSMTATCNVGSPFMRLYLRAHPRVKLCGVLCGAVTPHFRPTYAMEHPTAPPPMITTSYDVCTSTLMSTSTPAAAVKVRACAAGQAAFAAAVRQPDDTAFALASRLLVAIRYAMPTSR